MPFHTCGQFCLECCLPQKPPRLFDWSKFSKPATKNGSYNVKGHKWLCQKMVSEVGWVFIWGRFWLWKGCVWLLDEIPDFFLWKGYRNWICISLHIPLGLQFNLPAMVLVPIHVTNLSMCISKRGFFRSLYQFWLWLQFCLNPCQWMRRKFTVCLWEFLQKIHNEERRRKKGGSKKIAIIIHT